MRIIQVGHQDAKPKPSCEPAAKEVIALHMLIKRLPPKAKQSSQTHKSDTKKKKNIFFLLTKENKKKEEEKKDEDAKAAIKRASPVHKNTGLDYCFRS